MPQRGTGSASGALVSQPPSLSTYIQAALQGHISANPSVPKRRRNRRKNQHNESLKPALPPPPGVSAPPSAPAKRRRPKRRSKCKNAILRSRLTLNCREFIVQNLVMPQDLEDEDEAEEVQEEIRGDFQRFGELENVAIIKEEAEGRRVGEIVVAFKDAENAKEAFEAFHGKVFGGRTVECRWLMEVGDKSAKAVVVRGMVTADELEDPDEAADVEEEVMQLVSKHGAVKDFLVDQTTGDITVSFCEEDSAVKLVSAMHGSQYGGRLVTASLVESAVGIEKASPDLETKLFVAAQSAESTKSQEIVKLFLKRLTSLQERAHVKNPQHDKRSRRVVLGMHEVRRGLLVNKVRLLVLADDLEPCGLVDGNTSDLLDIATKQEVPVITPMNRNNRTNYVTDRLTESHRRKLGRALNKSVRVSCVGVYSVEGASDLFQQILTMMRTTT